MNENLILPILAFALLAVQIFTIVAALRISPVNVDYDKDLAERQVKQPVNPSIKPEIVDLESERILSVFLTTISGVLPHSLSEFTHQRFELLLAQDYWKDKKEDSYAIKLREAVLDALSLRVIPEMPSSSNDKAPQSLVATNLYNGSRDLHQFGIDLVILKTLLGETKPDKAVLDKPMTMAFVQLVERVLGINRRRHEPNIIVNSIYARVLLFKSNSIWSLQMLDHLYQDWGINGRSFKEIDFSDWEIQKNLILVLEAIEHRFILGRLDTTSDHILLRRYVRTVRRSIENLNFP